MVDCLACSRKYCMDIQDEYKIHQHLTLHRYEGWVAQPGQFRLTATWKVLKVL